MRFSMIVIASILYGVVLQGVLGCTADLIFSSAKENPSAHNGARVYAPVSVKVTKRIVTEKCPQREEQSIAHLPLGDPYDINVKAAPFAKSEFTVILTDSGLLKQVSLNSTPQAAETLKGLAEFTKALSEVMRPAVAPFVECGATVSEEIIRVERFPIVEPKPAK